MVFRAAYSAFVLLIFLLACLTKCGNQHVETNMWNFLPVVISGVRPSGSHGMQSVDAFLDVPLSKAITGRQRRREKEEHVMNIYEL